MPITVTLRALVVVEFKRKETAILKPDIDISSSCYTRMISFL